MLCSDLGRYESNAGENSGVQLLSRGHARAYTECQKATEEAVIYSRRGLRSSYMQMLPAASDLRSGIYCGARALR